MVEEKSFKEVFIDLDKKQKREVFKTAISWYAKQPSKFVKEKSKIALQNLKKYGKIFVKKLKNLSSTMEKKLKDAKISEYFKRSEKENEVENGKS